MHSPVDTPPAKWSEDLLQEWSGNWRIGVAAFTGGIVAQGIFASSISLFISPWQSGFGWSRGQILFAGTSAVLVALLAPTLGRLIDRVGVRPVLLFGILLSAIAYLGFTVMNGSILLYYASYLALSIGGLATSAISYSNAISRTFVRTRGISLAAIRSGVALGSGIGPVLNFYMISTHGWRSATAALVFLLLFTGLPAIWFWMRLPHIAAVEPTPRTVLQPGSGSIIRAPRFARLALGTSLNYVPVFVLLSQLHPLLLAKGLNAGVAAGFVGGLGIAALVGGWIAGFLIDRMWAPGVSAALSVGAAIGCAILFFAPPSTSLIFLAIVMIGAAYGAEHDMAPFLIAKFFGLERFSAVYGTIFLCFTLAAAVFSWLFGVLFDLTGQYALLMIFACLCFLGAAICHLSLGQYVFEEDRKGRH